ncbi:MAG TPA: hypothetical protein PKE15_00285 [Ottowia sp.]|nr:hypothetical protein [Ottowia sp.]
MAVSFVGFMQWDGSSSRSLNAYPPSGVANNDTLLAVVHCRGTPNTPVGWTKLVETDFVVTDPGLPTSQQFPTKIAIFSKNTVTSSPGSTTFTYSDDPTGIAAYRITVSMQCWRGVASISFAKNEVSGVSSWLATPPAVTVTADGSGIALFAGTAIWQDGTMYASVPAGFTNSISYSSGSSQQCVLAAQSVQNTGYTSSGSFKFSAGAYAEATPTGMATIALLLSPPLQRAVRVSSAPALGAPSLLAANRRAALASVPLPLGAPRLLLATNYMWMIGDEPVLSHMDLIMEDASTLRVPISSWQTTLQRDGQCYLSCAIPAPAAYLDAIGDAVSFSVSVSTTLRDGTPILKRVATAPVQRVQSDRGGTNYTAQISGYFAAYVPPEDEPPEAAHRAQRGVRSVSIQPNSMRMRCALDFGLLPGDVATFDGGSFVVAYKNVYATDTDLYQDIGSRVGGP